MRVEAITSDDRVGPAELEHELAALHAASANPVAGLFGPCSMLWRVNRESAVFLGAARALMLQLAHPWVAAAVARHSRSLTDPIGRFHRTFRVVFTMVFGTSEQALAAARRLHRRHESIRGVMPAPIGPFARGSAYMANNVPALCWVHATLVETAILSRALVLPPLSPAELARYYAEHITFARLFGIPSAAMPPDWPSFLAYVDSMKHSDILTVSPAARAIADTLLAGAGVWWLRSPYWYRAVTAQMLPPFIREGFGLAYADAECRTARRAIAGLRRIYPWLPKRVRCVGPYHEAMARLGGSRSPDLATRLSNRLWIGREAMGEP